MGYLPVSITLEIRKTRTSWLIIVRVHFFI
ncbi:hypothetical protein C8J34_101829 [Rhizobium sp. PP-F2F-G36]|nr:hypothetical protein C8J34_101829 [Rhizobium sp. PP-F2F-G36]